jgi:hypothetical protein
VHPAADFQQTPAVPADDDLDAVLGSHRSHRCDPVEDLLFGQLDAAVAAVVEEGRSSGAAGGAPAAAVAGELG